MSRTSKLTLKIFLAIFLNDFIDSVAQVFMKKGLVETFSLPFTFQKLIFLILHNAGSPLVWAGIFLYAINFFLWIGILSQVDLGLAVPIGSAVYLMVPAFAVIWLHEKMNFFKGVGIFLIIAGIVLLSQSKSSKPRMAQIP